MAVKRLIFVLVIVAGFTLFGLQNLSPSISLVFLGMRSLSLPLSMWVVMAIAAGILTSVIISALFRGSPTSINPDVGSRERGRSYTSTPNPPRPSSPPKPPVEPSGFSWGRGVESEPPQQRVTSRWGSGNATPSPASSAATEDDWETEVKPVNPSWEEDWTESGDTGSRSEVNPTPEPVSRSVNQSQEDEEWDWEEESTPSPEPEVRPPRDYEVEQQPKTQSWAGSIYSFGYRDTGETGVGKSESVYDADYRIITPPSGSTFIQEDQPQSQSDQNNEDWIDDEETRNRNNS